jgi:hypothetical protein
MARLKTIGFETGDTTELDSTNASVETTAVRSGNYSLRLGSSQHHASILFPANQELYFGFAVYLTTVGTADRNAFMLRNAGGTDIFKIVITTGGSWNVYYLSTLLFSTDPYSMDTWHYFEWHVKTDSTDGIVELRINGETVGSFYGNTGSELLTTFAMLLVSSGFHRHNLDDFVVNDTSGSYNNGFPGQPSLIPIPITGSGSATQLLRGGTDTGANWSQVNSIPPSSDYVYSADLDEYDLYTHDPVTIPTPETTMIYNFHVVVQARVEAGAGLVTSALLSGAELQEGESQLVSGTYQAYAFCHPLSEGGLPWTVDAVDAVEFGPKTKGLT